MYRNKLPRVYELRDIAQNPPSAAAYFYDFERKLDESFIRLKHFRDIEIELQALDALAWNDLKTRVAPLLHKMINGRGWQPFFDKLNEAKGYTHLVGIGFTNVAFIPESSVKGQKTPDLKGDREAEKALCEVKTINISNIEVDFRMTGNARTIPARLESGFFGKLKYDLEQAQKQMVAFDASVKTRKVVYTVINFDDHMHEYSGDYLRQIESYLASSPVPKIEIVFDIKPPYYSATG